MRSIVYPSPIYCCAQLWLDGIPQLWLVHLSDQFLFVVCCCMALLLLFFFFSIIDIQATRILIPLSLVMLLGLSLTWIASYVNLEILVLTFPALALCFWLIFCYGKKQLLYFSMIRGMLLTLIRSGNVSCTNHFTALKYLAQITAIGYFFLVMMSQN